MLPKYESIVANFKRINGEDVYSMFLKAGQDPLKFGECFSPLVERFETGDIKSIYLVSNGILEKHLGPRYKEKLELLEKNKIPKTRILRKILGSESSGLVAIDIGKGMPIGAIVDKNCTKMPVFGSKPRYDCREGIPIEADIEGKLLEEYLNKKSSDYRNNPLDKSHSHGESLIESEITEDGKILDTVEFLERTRKL